MTLLTVFPIIIATLIIIISLLDYLFSLFQILFKNPIRPTAAAEIDSKEHIYAHPSCTKQLKDHSSYDVKTMYEILVKAFTSYGDRPQFFFRHSSDQPFQSYTYKCVSYSCEKLNDLVFFSLDKYFKLFKKSEVEQFILVLNHQIIHLLAFMHQRQLIMHYVFIPHGLIHWSQ